jgi:hypothetical protein
MKRHTAYATGGVACLAIAGALYGLGQHEAAKPASAPAHPRETVTVTAQGCYYLDNKADRHCTPGAINPAVTQDNIHQTICVKGWTDTVRPPSSYTNTLKMVQLSRYGQPQQPKNYEEDHLIALEIGGDPTNPDNLWPEPRKGKAGTTAGDKDPEEGRLHAAVCSGSMDLATAQQTVLLNWTH